MLKLNPFARGERNIRIAEQKAALKRKADKAEAKKVAARSTANGPKKTTSDPKKAVKDTKKSETKPAVAPAKKVKA